MTRVLITGDHAFTRHSLAALVSSTTDLQLVGERSNGADLAAVVGEVHPHVVVMSVRSRDVAGIDDAGALQQLDGHPRVLMLTSDTDASSRPAARVPGAAGYVIRGGSPAAVLNAIRLVAVTGLQALPRVSAAAGPTRPGTGTSTGPTPRVARPEPGPQPGLEPAEAR